jgi:hypothetical protein
MQKELNEVTLEVGMLITIYRSGDYSRQYGIITKVNKATVEVTWGANHKELFNIKDSRLRGESPWSFTYAYITNQETKDEYMKEKKHLDRIKTTKERFSQIPSSRFTSEDLDAIDAILNSI